MAIAKRGAAEPAELEKLAAEYNVSQVDLCGGNAMDAGAFSEEWEQGWNSHNLGLILGHYRDDIVFHSKKAIPLLGSGEIVGKEALGKYWSAALDQQPDLHFRVQDVFEGYRMLVISYWNHRGILAAETLYFDDAGLVFQAAACHRSSEG